jgi:hypothetical protein
LKVFIEAFSAHFCFLCVEFNGKSMYPQRHQRYAENAEKKPGRYPVLLSPVFA